MKKLLITTLMVSALWGQRISPGNAEFEDLDVLTGAPDPADKILIFDNDDADDLTTYHGQKPLVTTVADILAAAGAGTPPDWSTLTGIPADIADGDDDTVYTFTMADLLALSPNVDLDSTDDFSGAWGDLTGIPSDIADGDDDDQTASEVPFDPTASPLTATTTQGATVELANKTRQITTTSDATGTGGVTQTTPQTLAENLTIALSGENENLTDLSAANSVRPQVLGDDSVQIITRNHHSRGAWVSMSGTDNRTGKDGRPLSPYDMLHPFATPKAAATALAADPNFDAEQDSVYITSGTYTTGINNLGSNVRRWTLDNATLQGTGRIFDFSTQQNVYLTGNGNSKVFSTNEYALFMRDRSDWTGVKRTIRISGVEYDGGLRPGSPDNRTLDTNFVLFSTDTLDAVIRDCINNKQCGFAVKGSPTDPKLCEFKMISNDYRYGTYTAANSDDGSTDLSHSANIYHINCVCYGQLGNNAGSTISAGAHIIQSFTASGTSGQKLNAYYIGGYVDATNSRSVFGGSAFTPSNITVYIKGMEIYDGKANPIWSVMHNLFTHSASFEFSESTPINFDPVSNTVNQWVNQAGAYVVDTARTN